MRLSADVNSPFYRPIADRATVTVDGVAVENVTEADEEDGWVEIVASDDNGSCVVGADAMLVVYRLTGNVRIVT